MRKHSPPSQVNEQPAYFTIPELANYSRLGQKCLYNATKSLELKHSRVGKRIIISRQDFEKWLAKRTKMTRDEIPRIPSGL